jgi:CubicO group peptidase (beta-lactamase class C family)
MTWRALAIVLLSIVVTPLGAAAADPLDGLDEAIGKMMKAHQVPGVAVAVVKDDKVVLARGYGVRELGKTAPVDADTLFAIGSCTKAFTATSVALLVDDGKLKWDDKVIDHLPDFRMYDPYVARELTVRDLLAHRCGLVRHDLMWINSPFTRAEMLKRFRHIKPDFSFRGKFSYQNGMYLVAGELAGTVAQTGWDRLVTDRLFKPLGMTGSNTTIRDLSKAPNVATPHDKVDGKWAPVPWLSIDNCAPAGSINSNVTDMARWVRFQLGDGTFEKTRLLTSGSLRQMQSAQTVMPLEGLWGKLHPESHLMSYGLGWMLNDYRGKKMVSHGGNTDGMSAEVGLLPELKLGVVVLSNRDATFLPSAVMYHVFDRYLSAPPKDWSAAMLKVEEFVQDIPKQQEKADEEQRVKETKPSLTPDQYAGEYTDELHGPFVVTAKDGKLSAAFHGWTFDLEHWHYDTFRASDRAKRLEPRFLVRFALGADGKPAGLKAEMIPDETLDMKRKPPKSATATVKLSEAEMKRLVGKYESQKPPLDLDVEVVGGKLKVSVGGGGSADLLPLKPTRFKVDRDQGGKEALVDFDLDGDKVKGVTVEQDKFKIKFAPKK